VSFERLEFVQFELVYDYSAAVNMDEIRNLRLDETIVSEMKINLFASRQANKRGAALSIIGYQMWRQEAHLLGTCRFA
jgi:hypothetical protein